jgi:HAD superfamily hydrolase (TIGR01490 family)
MVISSSKITEDPEYIAFFDVDGTITGANSGRSLVFHAHRKGMMSGFDLIRAINLSLLYKYNLREEIKIINDMVSWVKGLPEKTILEISSEVSSAILIPSIFSEVKAELEFHRSNNAKVVILSSALRTVCQPLADILGFDDILSSELEVVNGHYTGRSKGQLCFGEEKAIKLRKYCEMNNTIPEKAWYYGDSIPDLNALSIVGNPVCVNPDKKLKKIALKNEWKIYSWH